MPKTVYVSISEINELQTDIMEFIGDWVRKKKTPVPLKEIIHSLESDGVSKNNTIYSIKILVSKGYIRRAYTISNKTYFVMLKSI